MGYLLKIGIKNNTRENNNLTFKSDKFQKNKYQRQMEKYDYLRTQTQGLEALETLSLFTAILLGEQNADLSKKLPRAQKIGIAALLLSFGCFVISSIKKFKLSKKYDKEKA